MCKILLFFFVSKCLNLIIPIRFQNYEHDSMQDDVKNRLDFLYNLLDLFVNLILEEKF